MEDRLKDYAKVNSKKLLTGGFARKKLSALECVLGFAVAERPSLSFS